MATVQKRSKNKTTARPAKAKTARTAPSSRKMGPVKRTVAKSKSPNGKAPQAKKAIPLINEKEMLQQERAQVEGELANLRAEMQEAPEMTGDEVELLIESFRRAATLARTAGFDGVEMHGANHYTLHQFFSPRANQRDDAWGGSLEKRMRFPLAVARAVRDALGPDLIAGYRVTPFEAEADGYKLDDAKVLCDELAKLNLDYISISLDDFRLARPMSETRVYNKPLDDSNASAISPLIEIASTPLPARAPSPLSGRSSPACGEFGPDTTSTAFAPRSRAIIAL